MSERLVSIVKELTHEESRLLEHRDKLHVQLVAIDSRVQQVQEALVALGQKTRVKSNKKTSGRSSKPAATKNDVIEALSEILLSDGAMSEVKACKLTEAKIVSSGKSRTGLALRLREALKDDRFEIRSEQIHIAKSHL